MQSPHSTSMFIMYGFNTSTINNHICHVVILHPHSTTPSSTIITKKEKHFQGKSTFEELNQNQVNVYNCLNKTRQLLTYVHSSLDI